MPAVTIRPAAASNITSPSTSDLCMVYMLADLLGETAGEVLSCLVPIGQKIIGLLLWCNRSQVVVTFSRRKPAPT
jgi:hypothetical protein